MLWIPAVVFVLLLNKPISCEACKGGWELYNGMCYKIAPEGTDLSYSAAETSCTDDGAHLVKITDSDTDNNFLHTLLDALPDRSYWIELTYNEGGGQWEYANGDALSTIYVGPTWVTSFSAGASAGTPLCGSKTYSSVDITDVINPNSEYGSWTGLDCTLERGWICQEPDVLPTTDGVVTTAPPSTPEPTSIDADTTGPSNIVDPIDNVIANDGAITSNEADLALQAVANAASSGTMEQSDVQTIFSAMNLLKDHFTADHGAASEYIDVANDLLSSQNMPALEGAIEEQPSLSSVFLTGMEEYAVSLTSTLLKSFPEVAIQKSNLALYAKVISKDDVSTTFTYGNDGTVTLSATTLEEGDVDVTVLSYNTMDSVLTLASIEGHSYQSYGTTIVSISTTYHSDGSPVSLSDDNPVSFTMGVQSYDTKEEEPVCVYWQAEVGQDDAPGWSTEGCLKSEEATSDSKITCLCNHMTNFAALMRVSDIVISAKQARIMTYLTYSGVGLSIFALCAALFVFVTLKLHRSQRVIIHINFAVALLLAQSLFLMSGLAEFNAGLCKAVAIALHYFFLATFCWMLVEGINLYVKSSAAIGKGVHTRIYAAVGWGIPLVIVGVSAAVRFNNYGEGPADAKCWLSTEDGLIWAFVAPVLLVLVSNGIVFAMVIRAFMSLKTNADKSNVDKIRSGLRAALVLLPLLGLTWLIGIVQELQYLFIVLNSLQGVFFFVLHCMMNDEVKKAFITRRKHASSSVMSSVSNTENSSMYTRTTHVTKDANMSKTAWNK